NLGLHRAPWLWSVFEFVKEVYSPGRVRIGGDQFAPTYRHYAHNCPACTERARERVRRFNATDDPACLQTLVCDCRAGWIAELKRDEPPLLDRIETALSRLEASSLPMADARSEE